MRRFVLDASRALSWFLNNPVPNYAQQVRQALLKGARAVLPRLWPLEVAKGFAVSERRKMFSPSDVDRGLIAVEQLSLHRY